MELFSLVLKQNCGLRLEILWWIPLYVLTL